jgi:predicted anti-sigma-YlaC factor YlaD
MDDCTAIRKLMYLHLDGELDAKDSMRTQAHVAACQSCREMFLAEKAFLDLLKMHLMPGPAPPSARGRVASVRRRDIRSTPS